MGYDELVGRLVVIEIDLRMVVRFGCLKDCHGFVYLAMFVGESLLSVASSPREISSTSSDHATRGVLCR